MTFRRRSRITGDASWAIQTTPYLVGLRWPRVGIWDSLKSSARDTTPEIELPPRTGSITRCKNSRNWSHKICHPTPRREWVLGLVNGILPDVTADVELPFSCYTRLDSCSTMVSPSSWRPSTASPSLRGSATWGWLSNAGSRRYTFHLGLIAFQIVVSNRTPSSPLLNIVRTSNQVAATAGSSTSRLDLTNVYNTDVLWIRTTRLWLVLRQALMLYMTMLVGIPSKHRWNCSTLSRCFVLHDWNAAHPIARVCGLKTDHPFDHPFVDIPVPNPSFERSHMHDKYCRSLSIPSSRPHPSCTIL